MPSDLSYYDLLGLKPDAPQEDIRAAYDALMTRMKPNVERDSANTIRLAAAVKEAWETLGDPDKRRAYDETLRGTAAYADIWRRSQQSSYVEKRNDWFDQQVRRAQSDRQAAHELQAERKQFDEEYKSATVSKRAAESAREAVVRAAAVKSAAERAAHARVFRSLVIVAVVIALVAAAVWARGFFGRLAALPAAAPSIAAAPVASAPSASARPRAPNRARPMIPSAPRQSAASQAPEQGAVGAPATSAAAEPIASAQPARSTNPSQTRTGRPSTARSHRVSRPRPAYVCKTVAIASVTHGGATVDLSDGSRYQLTDPVDRAQAGGWITGSAIAECAWPAALKRSASLNVNGYTVSAQPAAIVAAATASGATPATPACADANITEVSDDGYGLGLSDGHVYAVDTAGHVTVSAWLVGDAVTVCAMPARGAKSYTVARASTMVSALRTQSLATAASAPTLCVVRLVSALTGDGSRVVFNDGHSYRVDSIPGRAIVAGWALGERVTVCIKLASGTVYATLAHGSLVAHAVRAD